MTQIEVPDWVAAEVLSRYSALRIERGDGEPWPPELASQQRQEDMRAAITAALGAWVVPVGYENRWHCTGNKWVSRDPAHPDDGDSQPTYVLRQEKPE